MDNSHRKSSLHRSWLFLKCDVLRMLEGKDYRDLDWVLPIFCGFIDLVTRYSN